MNIDTERSGAQWHRENSINQYVNFFASFASLREINFV
jgi:hypothetical protein